MSGIVGSVWQWSSPTTWLSAIWQGFLEALYAAWDGLKGLMWDFGGSWVADQWDSLGLVDMWESVEAWCTANLGWVKCVNMWIPIDWLGGLVGLYLSLVVGVMAYRLVKSWLPTLGG